MCAAESTKRAIITGVTGQDGAYLAQFLVQKGYQVWGTHRPGQAADPWRLQRLGVLNSVQLMGPDLSCFEVACGVVADLQPHEVYHLAAQSSVSESFQRPLVSCESDVSSALKLLEAVRLHGRDTRVFLASSAEMFGPASDERQSERTTLRPGSPYACGKVYGHHTVRVYREYYGTFACSGILFNHESPLRGAGFVTRKITQGFAQIVMGAREPLQLGNLDAQRDWGYAPEYVEGMWLMLQNGEPDDFVLATGQAHTVRNFVEFVASACGMEVEWETRGECEVAVHRETRAVLLESRPHLRRIGDIQRLCGDASRAKDILGWSASTQLPQLAKIMVDAELQRLHSKCP